MSTPRSPRQSSPRPSSTARCCTPYPARHSCSSAVCDTSATIRGSTAWCCPAMSFLDLVYAALGIDPVGPACCLIDGHEFATAAGRVTPAHTARRPLPCQLGAQRHQARRRRCRRHLQRRSRCRDPAAARHARRTRHPHDVVATRHDGRGRSPDQHLHPPSRRAPLPSTTRGSTRSPARCASSARGTSNRPTRA